MDSGNRWTALGLLIAGALILTACGPAATPPPPTATATPTQDPAAPGFEIKLSEFRFNPDRIELRVGQQVTFHVVNVGATDHEVMIGRNPLRGEDGVLGDGFEHDFFALTEPQVEGDAMVMGMEGEDMDMGEEMEATPEGEMEMEETPEGEMEMEATPEGEMEMEATPEGEMEMEEMAEEEGHHEGMENGFMVMFEPQQEATVTFTVAEEMIGAWTMGCFEISQDVVHFDEGMVGVVIVLPAE